MTKSELHDDEQTLRPVEIQGWEPYKFEKPRKPNQISKKDEEQTSRTPKGQEETRRPLTPSETIANKPIILTK